MCFHKVGSFTRDILKKMVKTDAAKVEIQYFFMAEALIPLAPTFPITQLYCIFLSIPNADITQLPHLQFLPQTVKNKDFTQAKAKMTLMTSSMVILSLSSQNYRETHIHMRESLVHDNMHYRHPELLHTFLYCSYEDFWSSDKTTKASD